MKKVNMCLIQKLLKILKNYYQQDSKVYNLPNKSFGLLLVVSLKKFIFLKTFNSQFLYIEVCFIDQNPKTLEIDDKINITIN